MYLTTSDNSHISSFMLADATDHDMVFKFSSDRKKVSVKYFDVSSLYPAYLFSLEND